MFKGIHHVAYVVKSVDAAMEYWDQAFGMKPYFRERFEADGVDLAIYQVGDTFFEVSGPLGDSSPLQRFLDEKGQGIHHLAFKSHDIQASIDELVGRGTLKEGQKTNLGRSGWTVTNVDSTEALGIGIQMVNWDR